MTQVIAVVPIYQSHLPKLDEAALDYSLAKLRHPAVFVAPAGLNVEYYRQRYPTLAFEYFAVDDFASIAAYNRLLLSARFYERFLSSEFILILQTDALIFEDRLDEWTQAGFDYVGAPWPDGLELFINLDRFEGGYGKKVRAHVGNGGLSLRRTASCLRLLNEFPNAVNVFLHSGSSEDLFFAFMGGLSADFRIPNEITAAHFSLELKPAYYHHVTGGHVPMGAHAWCKYDLAFWQKIIPDLPAVPDMAAPAV